MSLRREVHELLTEAGLRPRKGLGQNFLVDDSALRKIVGAAELTAEDIVVEIGPGLGTLTRLLADQAHRVLAVEIDPHMVTLLRRVLAGVDNVDLVQADILTLDLDAMLGRIPASSTKTYKVVANLPYYITSAVLRHLLGRGRRPSCMVLTVQEEVARRIVAQPGDLSLLALSVQVYGMPRIVARIPAGAFYPAPKVNSAVVRIDVKDDPTVEIADIRWFFSVARAGFSGRRKQLHNALSRGLGLSPSAVNAALLRADITPSRRAQTLSLDEWARLSKELAAETGRS
mgnify:CR=1 FL=1